MRMPTAVLCASLAVLVPFRTRAAAPEAGPAAVARAGEEQRESWGIGLHPVIGYGPETSLVLGAVSVLYFNPRPEDERQRLDALELSVNASAKGQYSLKLQLDKHLRGNDYDVKTAIGFLRFPTSFYGIGADAPASNEEQYTPASVPFSVAFLFNVRDVFYVGPVYDAQYNVMEKTEPGGLLASKRILGSETLYSSGLGVTATYDSTNRGLYKREGTLLEARTVFYSPAFLGASSFRTAGINYRRYLPLFSRSVLGLQLRYTSTFGDVPFYYLPSLGESRIVRGYSEGRYIAHHSIAAQAEFRTPLFWRFGGAVFAAAGDVAERPRDLGTKVRGAAGLGLRFALNTKQTINLRFDLACNTDGDCAKYVKILEAF